jgi:catechol 2,3-dioxygenase-like lactoylglutathione lyase family enzyme
LTLAARPPILASVPAGRIGVSPKGPGPPAETLIPGEAPMSEKPHPSLSTLKKQAKQLKEWHRAGNYSVGGRIRILDRYRELTDAAILALDFPLAEAQEVIARERGFPAWADLKAALETAAAEQPPPPAGPTPEEPPRLAGAAPVLYVSDVTRSACFFRDRLGFAVDFLHGHPPFYGAVRRDDVCIHLRHVHEPVVARELREREALLSVYVDVENVRALYRECLAAGAPMRSGLKKEPWGASTFVVEDPDGNWISFNGPVGY